MGILVITVDLECCRCKAKITKVLDCLKGEFGIEKVEFEDKDKKVVVRGKYDAEELCKKVWRKACKVVEEIVIVEVWPIPPPPKQCKPCKEEPEHCTTKPDSCKAEPEKCECYHCKPCKEKPEKCDCEHSKPEPQPKTEDEKPKTPPPKTEYKLVPCPYPLLHPMMCQSWPWQCPPQQQCQSCQKPPPPPPQHPRPCICSNHGNCGCGGVPLVWPPQPLAWPPPWGGYNIVTEENPCSVM